MKQVIGKDGVSTVKFLSQEDLDVIAADELAAANFDPVADKQAKIDSKLADPALAYLIEAIEEALHLPKGKLIADQKARGN